MHPDRCSSAVVFLVVLCVGPVLECFAQGATRDMPTSCGSLDLPISCGSGELLVIAITVDAPGNIVGMLLEDSPPDRWTQIDNISDGGSYDSVHHKVKWGPFFSNLSRTVSYEVTPPEEPTGEDCFEGTVFFDGTTMPIEGDECCARLGLNDHAMLVECLAGPGRAPGPTQPLTAQDCLDAFDCDGDNDVDLLDVGGFQRGCTGGP